MSKPPSRKAGEAGSGLVDAVKSKPSMSMSMQPSPQIPSFAAQSSSRSAHKEPASGIPSLGGGGPSLGAPTLGAGGSTSSSNYHANIREMREATEREADSLIAAA